MENQNFPIQGNDPRRNADKPATTFQKAYTIKDATGQDMRVLEVHVNDDPFSPLYFHGVPEMYNNGAVKSDHRADDFVGDDATV